MNIGRKDELRREIAFLRARLGGLQEKAKTLRIAEDEIGEMARLTKQLMALETQLRLLDDVAGEA